MVYYVLTFVKRSHGCKQFRKKCYFQDFDKAKAFFDEFIRTYTKDIIMPICITCEHLRVEIVHSYR